MSSNGIDENGAIVIADVTFREGAPELVQWSSGRLAAVAPIELTVATGITVTVDVAQPSQILDVAVADFGDPALLVAACEPDGTSLVDQIVAGDAPSGGSLTLRPGWARRALVDGIARWLPTPLHEGGLLLDEAAAHQEVGESAAAARKVALGLPVLEALAADAEDGFLSTATMLVLNDIARCAAEAVTDLDWGAEVAELSARIAAAAGLSDLDMELALAQLSEQEPMMLSGATHAGDVVGPFVVDPAVTTARIIKWEGARRAELRVTESTDRDEVIGELEASLSDFVDERCLEVDRVRAYVADSESGAVLRTARTQVDGRTLKATLRYSRPAGARIVYGVFDADEGVTAVRTNAEDQATIDTDRKLIDAWSAHRASVVARMRLGDLEGEPPAAAQVGVDTLTQRALDVVDDARDELSDAIGQQPRSTYSHRLAAIDAYLARISAAPEPECGPLLAELLPLTPGAQITS